ncbi:polyprenyl synthetase family protein [Promethearchaeum syntrophicum]|uniref:Polyprenyl synthetase family protein n=1 Tax=Promethearchaeum syntrophicum TaxID=2594042 RepID=A0A5B9D8I8_9ARCH|nr:polyprenyl synthetase family protein [Candidatus Prometheoarchaeum syntrophicum]QEE15383.1 Geranylgeranyl diphosphate synthase [Candidatus Prometheoarchaeum syntrophicum]
MDNSELTKKKFQEIAEKIDDFILNNLSNKVLTLWKASQHYITAGGKRLRPFFIIKAYSLLAENYENIIPIAAAVEILHTFSLIHDDIMDQDPIRRNVPTVHTKWDESLAILAGDFLLSQAFVFVHHAKIPQDIKYRVLLELGRVSSKLCEGQTMDIEFEERIDVSIEEYMRMVELKTGALFEVSTFIGGLCAKASKIQLKSLEEFGNKFGISFQIIDDILGLIGDEKKFGKPIGSDLREGKKTFLLIYALEHLKNQEKRELITILSKKEKTNEDISKGIELIKNSGAIEIAKKIVKNKLDEAIAKLEIFPDSESKKELQKLALFSIQRTY